MRIHTIPPLLLIAGVIVVGHGTPACAISVSPGRVVLQAKPGQVLHGSFLVSNEGQEPIDVSVEPEDWGGGMTGARGPVPWLTITPTAMTIKPGKQVHVHYTIHVPKDAQAELRTQIFFTTHAGLRSRLGSIIYVTIHGAERLEAAITHLKAFYTASTPGVARPDRLDVAIRIHNRSNVHIVPEGEVLVRNRDGIVVGTIPLPAGWGLLPKEEDLYHAVGNGIFLKEGTYRIEISMHCGADLHHPITVTKMVKLTVPTSITPDGQLEVQELSEPSK